MLTWSLHLLCNFSGILDPPLCLYVLFKSVSTALIQYEISMTWSLYEFCNPSVDPSSNGIKIYLKVMRTKLLHLHHDSLWLRWTHSGRNTPVQNHKAIEGRLEKNITKWWATTTFNWARCYLNKLDVSQVVIDGWYFISYGYIKTYFCSPHLTCRFLLFLRIQDGKHFFQYHWNQWANTTKRTWMEICLCLFAEKGKPKVTVLANRIILINAETSPPPPTPGQRPPPTGHRSGR